MKPTAALAIAIATVLGGCAGVSDVVPAGNGTYMVTAHGAIGQSSGAAQKARAYEEASDYCQHLRRTFEPIDSSENESDIGRAASAEVEFRCVAPESK